MKCCVFWPGFSKMVEKFCAECPEDGGGGMNPGKLPLISMPLAGHPFDQIALDVAGPFP